MTLILDNEVRQEQVAQAALAVVAEHGIRRLRLASVARAGVTPSALARSDLFEQSRPLLARHVQFIKDHPALPRIIVSEQGYEGRRGRRRAMFRTIWRTLGAAPFFCVRCEYPFTFDY